MSCDQCFFFPNNFFQFLEKENWESFVFQWKVQQIFDIKKLEKKTLVVRLCFK